MSSFNAAYPLQGLYFGGTQQPKQYCEPNISHEVTQEQKTQFSQM
jgi:hypothetical protein